MGRGAVGGGRQAYAERGYDEAAAGMADEVAHGMAHETAHGMAASTSRVRGGRTTLAPGRNATPGSFCFSAGTGDLIAAAAVPNGRLDQDGGMGTRLTPRGQMGNTVSTHNYQKRRT